ncbi:hypothetical protein LCGC14_0481870 [marine sediment metagenome]|uniref:Uncharacterized protein n=1 Tax=marine sediment metagenome TaxID=412755 RepID=A0A0F9SSH4_9ZZZZ
MGKQATAQKQDPAATQSTKESTDKTVELSKAQQAAVAKLDTVSARIRYLDAEGYSRSDITKAIPNAKGNKLLYQHVRNVLITPVGKASS